MRKYLILINITFSLSCFSQAVEWVKAEPYPSWIQWTNVIVHDNFGNTFTGSQYSNGVAIFKYDMTGNKVWQKIYTGTNSVTSMCVDTNGNLYVVFLFGKITINGIQHIRHGNTNLFVKFDASGNIVWVHETSLILKISKKTDSQGNIIGTGWFMDTVHLENNITLTSQPSTDNLFIAKFNANGECIWAIQDDGSWAYPIILRANGDMSLYSDMLYKTITLGKDTNLITLNPSNGGTYIAKYSPNADLEWTKQVSTTIAPDETGNLYSFEIDISDVPHGSNRNKYLVKYDASGNEIWKRTHLYLPDGYKFSMKCGTNGNLYITGGFRNYMTLADTTINGNGSYHVFVAKIDSSGALKWIITTGGTGAAGAKDITIANGNEIYITGDMSGTNTFGTYSVNQPNGVFVAKIIDNDVSTSIKDFPKTNTVFNVYPNPSTNIVNVVYNSNSTIEKFKLEIKNSIGQVIYSTSSISINGEFKKTIDLSKQTKGIYFIEIIADKKREVKKIILN